MWLSYVALLIKQLSCFYGCRVGWITSWASVNSSITFLLNMCRTFLYSLELFSVQPLGREMFLFSALLYSWRNFCRSVEKWLQEICSVMYLRLYRKKKRTLPPPINEVDVFYEISFNFLLKLPDCSWLYISRNRGIIVSKNSLGWKRLLEII